MPLALDYYKLFTGTEEVRLKFKLHGDTVEYSQHGKSHDMCRVFNIDGFMLFVEKVDKNRITFKRYVLNRIVKFTIKYTDIKLLP